MVKKSSEPARQQSLDNQNSKAAALKDPALAIPAILAGGQVHETEISDTLKDNYMPYAMSVIVSRAIPEIDGFKPAHRKLLYTMYKMGLLSGPRSKSANVVGATMKLNPHGDQAIYDTLVRLTKGNAALLHPYLDSKGNMGKQYSKDMQSAASRYTEVKLADIAAELFRGIDEDMIDFVPNYDGTLEEPTLLPVAFPSILVNANQGIAVGMASNICSFNLKEVCAATIAYIADPTCDLLDYLQAPDFPSGATLLYDRSEMRNIYNTGRGSFKLRAKYTINPKQNCIEITEIPYTSTVEAIIDKLAELVKSNKIKEIVDVRDETDINGLRITIDYRKSVDPEKLMQKLFSLSDLENSYACNFNVLINGRPAVLGIRSLISEWLNFRRQCVRRQLAFKEGKLREKLHLLSTLEAILVDIDRAIKIIRDTKKDSDVVPNLAAAFEIDQVQANYIAEIKLRQLNKEHLMKRLEEIAAIKNDLAEIAKLLSSTSLLDQLISEELAKIADKYGQARKTELIAAHDIVQLSSEAFIDDFKLKIFLTADGYLKKHALTSLRSAGDLKLKDNDRIVAAQEATNKQELLVFSSLGNLYKLKLYELNDDKPSDWGTYLPNILDLMPDEKVVGVVATSDYQGEIAVAYQDGRVSRVDLVNYETKQNRKKLIKAVSVHAPVIAVKYLPNTVEFNTSDTEFVLFSTQKRALLFNLALVQKKSTRSNRGDQVMRLKAPYRIQDFVALNDLANPEDWQRHRALKLPSSGVTIKSYDVAARQVGLFS